MSKWKQAFSCGIFKPNIGRQFPTSCIRRFFGSSQMKQATASVNSNKDDFVTLMDSNNYSNPDKAWENFTYDPITSKYKCFSVGSFSHPNLIHRWTVRLDNR